MFMSVIIKSVLNKNPLKLKAISRLLSLLILTLFSLLLC